MKRMLMVFSISFSFGEKYILFLNVMCYLISSFIRLSSDNIFQHVFLCNSCCLVQLLPICQQLQNSGFDCASVCLVLFYSFLFVVALLLANERVASWVSFIPLSSTLLPRHEGSATISISSILLAGICVPEFH